jgi:hypothetical protein
MSASLALQLATKYTLLKSIIKSPRFIGKKAVSQVTGTIRLPDVPKLIKKTIQELKDMSITKV